MNAEIKEITVDEVLKDIVIIYHRYCPDGLASAWVAWKKFGDNASYIPLKRGEELHAGLEGKEVYMLDFSYEGGSLARLQAAAKRLVVIDHHLSAQKDVEAVKEHVFSLEHSGAYLAWHYFNEGDEVPLAISYLSASDNGNFNVLKDQSLLTSYITSLPLTFDDYTKLIEEFSTEEGLRHVYEKAHLIESYQDKILEPALSSVHFVVFEGHTIPAVNVCLPISERSHLLRRMYELYGSPFALSYRYDEGEWKCSLRSNGEFDVSVLAGKYGGGGHKGAAGFAIEAAFPFPIATLKEANDIL